jgi:hypothetical protein
MNAVLASHAAGGHRPIPADVGIGLCPDHHALVLDRQPTVAWFEVHADTLLARGDWLREVESIARTASLSVHAAGLSLGSATRPETCYLDKLRALITRLQPDFVSDHLSWSAVDGIHLPGMLPLPYTEEALTTVVRNVIYVQETLKRQILLETPAQTIAAPDTALTEESFLAEVVLRTGCGVVLDLNNLHAGASHLGMNADTVLERFLEALWPESIAEIHLAVNDGAAVRELFRRAIAQIGPVPTLIEWDGDTPAFDALQAAAAEARSILFSNTQRAETHAIAP